MACADDELAGVAHGKGRDLAVVAIDSLDLLELVAVPVLDRAVLACTKEVVPVPSELCGTKATCMTVS